MPRDRLEGNAPAQEGGVADKSCVLRIHCAPFQAGDVRLPSAKRGGDPCLAQALALTFSRKLTDQSPRLKRGFEQLGEVWIHRITGQFVLCARRPGKKNLYPNAVVEKQLGVPATTRNWNTFVKIGQLLET